MSSSSSVWRVATTDAVKAAIQQRAEALGFDACGITTTAPPATAERFRRWLETGQHGEMAYLRLTAGKRADPQQVLSGARSIIVVAASYLAGETDQVPRPAGSPTAQPPPATGFIARYARYADYHEVLGARLRALAKFVSQLGGYGTRSLWHVDTGPVLERDLAQRAGVGFVGKHTNLIRHELGNWFFLAEILTTLELEPDRPERNRCGTCSRCLAACPTGAIIAPFQLDARRCLSYLTIELKGPIPVELRPALGPRIFGCDDCLAVCPWNRLAKAGRLLRDCLNPDLANPDLPALLTLDETEFKRRFGQTPLARIKRRGLLRNVAVALGNIGDERVLPFLERAAQDPTPLIADHAQWAVRQIEFRRAGIPPRVSALA
jgi:epoxyqueuosine reductase